MDVRPNPILWVEVSTRGVPRGCFCGSRFVGDLELIFSPIVTSGADFFFCAV